MQQVLSWRQKRSSDDLYCHEKMPDFPDMNEAENIIFKKPIGRPPNFKYWNHTIGEWKFVEQNIFDEVLCEEEIDLFCNESLDDEDLDYFKMFVDCNFIEDELMIDETINQEIIDALIDELPNIDS